MLKVKCQFIIARALRFILMINLAFLTKLSAQNAEWMSYTHGKNILALAVEGDLIWVGTSDGVVKINGVTGETNFYNQLNAHVPLNEVRSIAIDKNGNKWIGRWDDSGVTRFDDANWSSSGTLYRILSLAIDGKQNVWAGSGGSGLEKMEVVPGNIKGTTYTKSNSGLPNNYINALAFDPIGNLWIGTDPSEATTGGLVKFDGKNWTVYTANNSGLPSNRIWSLAVDKKSGIWIGTYRGGLAQFKDEKWIVYNKSNLALPSNDITAVAVDSVGNIWVGTWIHGLAKFDGTNWLFFNKENSELPSNDITRLVVDSKGSLWVGTYGGLAKFDGTHWQAYNTSSSVLPTPYVRSLLADKRGNIWIGTLPYSIGTTYIGGGLVKFDGNNWIVYNWENSRLPSDNIGSLALDWSGNLWISAYGGIIKFDQTDQTFQTFVQPELQGTAIYSLIIDLFENIWMGTWDKGVAKFDGENWELYKSSNSDLPGDRVYSLARDVGGNLWLGTDKGLAKLDQNNSWKVYSRSNSSLPCDTVLALCAGKNGDLWIGTYAGGLTKFNGKDWIIYNPSNSELPSRTVNALTLDRDDILWIGTQTYYGNYYNEGGLAKFDGTKWTTYRYANSGLPSNYIYSIAIDRNGNKWIGTSQGVAVFKEGGVKFTTTNVVYDFNLAQSFPNPFNLATRINYSLSQPDYVDLMIYNLRGQLVKTLINEYKAVGEHSVLWDGKDDRGFNVASGIYFCQFKVDKSGTINKKVVLSK